MLSGFLVNVYCFQYIKKKKSKLNIMIKLDLFERNSLVYYFKYIKKSTLIYKSANVVIKLL